MGIHLPRKRFLLMVSLTAGVFFYHFLTIWGGLARLLACSIGHPPWLVVIRDLATQCVDSLGFIYSWSLLLLAITFLSWLFTIANNARILSPDETSPPGGEAVSCWLIPFINLVVPFLQMAKIWQASHRHGKVAILPYTWWALHLCTLGLMIHPEVLIELQAPACAATSMAFCVTTVSIQRAQESRTTTSEKRAPTRVK